jgi:hypothetical protein
MGTDDAEKIAREWLAPRVMYAMADLLSLADVIRQAEARGAERYCSHIVRLSLREANLLQGFIGAWVRP